MLKKHFAFLAICLFFLAIITSACGGGGKTTPPSYPFIPVPTPTISPTPEPTPTPAKYQLELSKTEFTVNVGATDNITVKLNGEDITQTATYTVDQEAIATVEGGLITGISVGVTTVTVHAQNAESDKTFTVNVINPNLPTLELSKTEFTVNAGETDNVTVTLEGEDVTDKVKYELDKEGIATVEKGLITGIEDGKVTVTVSLEGANSAIFTVKVNGPVSLTFDDTVIDQLYVLGKLPKDSAHLNELTELEIPDTFTYNGITYKITSIDVCLFNNCTSLRSVTIPDTVNTISRGVFYDCTSLESVTIPDTVLCIFPSAFYNCNNLTKLTTKSGKEINIPEDIVSTSENVTFIGVKVNCYDGSSVESITGEIIIPDGVTEIPDNSFEWFKNITKVTIPNSVKKIESGAFNCCDSLKSITIPDSVTTIGAAAFQGCNLESVTISDNTLCIFPDAFAHCNNLTKLTTKSGKEIDIPKNLISKVENVTFINVKGFDEQDEQNIKIEEIILPDEIIEIPTSSFSCWYDLLPTINIPDGVQIIKYDAFYYCNLENVTIPDSVAYIGPEAFYCDTDSNLSIDIPENLIFIGKDAFYGVNNINITEEQKSLANYPWGALHVNGEEP